MKRFWIAGLVLSSLMLGYVTHSVFGERPQKLGGFIGCEGGWPAIRDIEIDLRTMNIPEGESVIRIEKDWCKQ